MSNQVSALRFTTYYVRIKSKCVLREKLVLGTVINTATSIYKVLVLCRERLSSAL